jgi:hypothetical protein
MKDALKQWADRLFSAVDTLETATTEAERISVYQTLHEIAFEIQNASEDPNE